MKRIAAALLLFCLSASGQTPELSSATTFIAKAVRHNRDALAAGSACTCLQTIERAERKAHASSFRRLDLVRVEVVKVGNRELFAWPGGEFQDKPLSYFAGGGLLGDGMFSLFADDVFVNNAARMTYRGADPLSGRPGIRVDYVVDSLLGKFTLRTATGEAEVSYRGSFRVDPESLDLIRMDIVADNIPPALQLTKVQIRLDFTTSGAGEKRMTRTGHSVIELVTSSGDVHRDEITFTNCRQFAGESTLLVASTDESPLPASLTPGKTLILPGDLDLRLTLQNSIDISTAGVGDAITAVVASDVKDKHGVLIPGGSQIHGRIRRLDRREGQPAYVLAGLEFSDIELGQDTYQFIARLQSIEAIRGISTTHQERKETRTVNQPNGVGSGGTIVTTVEEAFDSPLAGVGYLYLSNAVSTIPAGLRMAWKTEDLTPGKGVK
jgi:hypothetical protein